MLAELSIKNFAIIDDLTIRFADGLTILSGETGAGKSIIINAINLLLGSRATSKMIRSGEKNAEIEALFHLPATGLENQLLEEQGIESGEELLIRRTISNSDRHRVYINGRLSTMQMLNRVTENLAAISGQHEHQQLLNENRHLLILDQFGDILPLRRQVHDAYHQILPLIRELEDLQKSRHEQEKQMELMAFQKQEIEDAEIEPDEDDLLKKEQARLKNAETLFQTVAGISQILYTGDGAIAEKLGEVKRELEKAARMDDTLNSTAAELADTVFRIEDVARELTSYADNILFDEHRLEEIEIRLDLLNRLKRKYGGSLEAVMAHLASISREMTHYDSIDDKISQLEEALTGKHRHLAALAEKLSARRKDLSVDLARQVEKELHALKMPDTRFEIAFNDIPAPSKTAFYLTSGDKMITETGTEQACFMIAPNIGEDVKPLSHIASGGELSRVVLALKSITAGEAATGTMIFDEVDAGIGGEVAEVVGKKLSRLAVVGQVICITHLAQIAAFGDHHFKISKQVENKRTCTRITPLDPDRRLDETARMIGGEKITPATVEHAREMIQTGSSYRQTLSN